MPPKKLVYFGSPSFSAWILESIITLPPVQVAGVVTQPDRPTGRKQILSPSPVAQTAQKHSLPLFKPAKLDNAHLSHIRLLKPDIFLVASYGKIIPPDWLETPTVGTFNIHFSLLPKYRGALCISEAIKNQDPETGVTLMEMDKQLDHGPIIAQKKVVITFDDDIASLTTKLTQAAIQLLDNKLPEICAQKYTATPQDETKATYTPKTSSLTHQSAHIPWNTLWQAMEGTNATAVHALIRSLSPEPGAWTNTAGKEIKILKSSLEGAKLEIVQVQLQGKSPISWKQFTSGYNV